MLMGLLSQSGNRVDKPPSKADIRAAIEQQVRDYLQDGGKVNPVARGISGRENALQPLDTRHVSFNRKPQSRTYLTDVVAQIDARRNSKSTASTTKSPRRPRKRMVYDDFGEPLRWEWVDE